MKNLTLTTIIMLLLISQKTLHAQCLDWNKILDSSKAVNNVAIDEQHNVIVASPNYAVFAGYSATWATQYLVTYSLTKYDRNGNRLWVKTVADTVINHPYNFNIKVTLDHDGNIYTVPTSENYSVHRFTPISRFDQQGNRIWKQVFTCMPSSFCVSENGDVFVAGDWHSLGADTVSLGGITLPAKGFHNFTIGKIDHDGTVAWLNNFGARVYQGGGMYFSPRYDPISQSIAASNQQVYFTLYNTGYADIFIGQDTSSSSGSVLVKLDGATGALGWARKLRSTASGSIVPTGGGFTAVAPNGECIFSTTTRSTIYFNNVLNTDTSSNASNIICAYDSLGNEKWIKRFSGFSSGLKQAGGNYFVINYKEIIKVSPEGNVLNRIPFPLAAPTTLTGYKSHAAASDGTIAYTGVFTAPYLFQGGDTLYNNNGSNIGSHFVAKLLGQTNTVSGYVFRDLNSNGIKDINEPGIPNISIGSIPSKVMAITNSNGYYECLADSGNYILKTRNGIQYHNPLPAAGFNIVFNGYNNVLTNKDFAMQPIPGIKDLQVTLTPLTATRPGFNVSYSVQVKNLGSVTQNGTVGIKVPSNITLQSTWAHLDSARIYSSADSTAFRFFNLAPYQSTSFYVPGRLSPATPINSRLSSYATVLPTMNDSFPSDNFDTLQQQVTGSYDPNDKTVFPEGDLNITQKDKPLTYVIRFQNTGNDTAFNVQVIDTLSAKLDLSSIQIIASSHPVNTVVDEKKVLHFYFDNILLVDSMHNEPLSHGYIRFTIKPKADVNIGDHITNRAFIYFDYNEAIITNTASTKYVATVLPVTLQQFTAQKGRSNVLLHFVTSLESGLQAFDIERSTDGNRFVKIGSMDASGRASTYNFIDAQPINGLNFYRLKMKDADGKFTYSTVQLISFNASNQPALTIYPNPVQQVLKFDASTSGAHTCRIYNTAGQLQQSIVKNIAQASTISVTTDQLNNGVYYLEVSNGKGVNVSKFIVRK